MNTNIYSKSESYSRNGAKEMPTENRSSNTEVVSVPRERALQLINLLAGVASAAHWLADNSEDCGDEGIDCQRADFEALSGALDNCEELPELPDSVYVRDGWLRAADELRALLAQPAEQHQGEPVALPERRGIKLPADGEKTDAQNFERGWLRGWNACLDEIAKLGPLYSRPAQGEPMAYLCKSEGAKWLQYGSKVGEPWKPSEVEVTPLYTHSDPGGVVMSKEKADAVDKAFVELQQTLYMERDDRDQRITGLHGDIGALRAQLAEWDALLTRTLPYLSNTPDLVQHGAEDLAEEIRSASAGRPCYGPNEWGTECGKCSKCKHASAEPSAPLPPVDGDLLPPIGSKVLFNLGREDEWVEHTVVGYYVWGNHGLDQNVHRVFVRARDADGYLNARLLSNLRAALERKP